MSAKRVLSQKHKGKKGLAAFLFSRFFLFGLMVVLQVLMFVFFAYNASVEKNLNYVIMVSVSYTHLTLPTKLEV